MQKYFLKACAAYGLASRLVTPGKWNAATATTKLDTHHCKQPPTNTAHIQLWQHWWRDSHTDNHSPANHDGITGSRTGRLLQVIKKVASGLVMKKQGPPAFVIQWAHFALPYCSMYPASSLQTQGTKGWCMPDPCCVPLYRQEPKKDLTPRTWYSRLHCNRPASLLISTLQT